MTIRAIIIEDSRLARLELQQQLKSFPDIQIVAEAENAFDGQQAIEEHRPDLIFLDINMPGRDGFEMLEQLSVVPAVIFTTAYDDYAIKAFEINALDYLMKPITKERLATALEKVSASEVEPLTMQLEQQFFIKEGENCFLVKLADVQQFQSVGNYTRVFFNGVNPMTYRSLAQVEAKLPEDSFFRANRSHIVNLNWVRNLQQGISGAFELTLENGNVVELSQRKSTEFKKRWTL